MTPPVAFADLLMDLARRGIGLEVVGDKLRVVAGRAATITNDVRELVTANKPALMAAFQPETMWSELSIPPDQRISPVTAVVLLAMHAVRDGFTEAEREQWERDTREKQERSAPRLEKWLADAFASESVLIARRQAAQSREADGKHSFPTKPR